MTRSHRRNDAKSQGLSHDDPCFEVADKPTVPSGGTSVLLVLLHDVMTMRARLFYILVTLRLRVLPSSCHWARCRRPSYSIQILFSAFRTFPARLSAHSLGTSSRGCSHCCPVEKPPCCWGKTSFCSPGCPRRRWHGSALCRATST